MKVTVDVTGDKSFMSGELCSNTDKIRLFAQDIIDRYATVEYFDSRIFDDNKHRKGLAAFELTESERDILKRIHAWLPDNQSMEKRYDFWFTYRRNQAIGWEGGQELSMNQRFRNDYSILSDGRLRKNIIPGEECSYAEVEVEKLKEATEYELMFEELNKDAQKRVLQFYGLSCSEDGNLDTQPLTVLALEGK